MPDRSPGPRGRDARRCGTRAAGLAAALLLAACSVAPVQVTEGEVRDRAAADRRSMFDGQEPVAAPVSLEEAIARALKYNLELRSRQMEAALAGQLHTVSKYDMLPSVVASAGYSTRSNASGGRSVNIDTGLESLSPSTSQDRSRSLASLEFGWNLLDFGVSYYRARQRADEYLVAEERRRRVAQTIVHDVRIAWWRALGAQRLEDEAQRTMVRADRALTWSREAESRGAVPITTALAYQRSIVDAVALMNARRQELALARTELASLMGLAPGTPFTLADREDAPLPPAPTDLLALEDRALGARAELREEDYRRRISALETRRQMLSVFPNLSLTTGVQYDSNSLLYNNNWVDGGLRLTQSLMRLAALPDLREAGERQKQADDARRQALAMAVLTQTRLAVLRYDLAMVDLGIALRSHEVDARIDAAARAGVASRTETELEATRAAVRALASRLSRAGAYASAQGAYARIQHSIGEDLDPGDVQGLPVADLARRVAARLAAAEGSLAAYASAARPPKVWLYTEPDSRAASLRAALAEALGRSGFESVRRRGDADLLLKVDVALHEPSRGLRRGEVRLEGFDRGGRRTGRSTWSAMLPPEPRESVLVAIGQTALTAHVESLRAWAQDPPEEDLR